MIPHILRRAVRSTDAATMIRKQLPALLVALFGASLANAATFPIEAFSDSFEGSAIYHYWTVSEQQFGGISLSQDHAYSGSHSLKFTSTSGGERNMMLTHKFNTLTKGAVSVAFYDAAPGQETLYERLVVLNSQYPSVNASVGTHDFDSECYMANVGTSGPNANCGIYPQETTAPVERTPGWHLFSIFYDPLSVSISIDGRVICTTAGDYRFDTIEIYVDGPYWRPNTVAYFDNFSFIP
jgi:hypothetical protein